MAQEDVILNFIVKGGRTVSRNLGDIRNRSQRAVRSVSNLDRALVSLGGFLTIRTLQQYADTFTLLQNRLRLVTENTSELAAVTEELFQVSQRTFTNFEDTGTLYARLARSVTTLSISQKELLEITEAISQATALSSPTIQAAQAGLVQLAQAIGSDRLQGDELRSILENIPRVGQAIADGLDVPFQKLRELGEQGKLTAQSVIKALKSQIGTLQKEFESFVPSVSFALNNLNNAFLKFIGTTDQAAGISKTASQALLLLADNFDTVATAVLTATAVLVGGAISRALLSIATFAKVAAAGLGALFTVIVANPIGALVTLLAAGIAALVGFQDKIRPFANNIITLGDAFRATKNIIVEDLTILGQELGLFEGTINSAFSDTLRNVLSTVNEWGSLVLGVIKNTLNRMIGGVVQAVNVIELTFEVGLAKIYQAVLVSAQDFWNRNLEIAQAGAIAINDVLGSELIPVLRYDFVDEEARASLADLRQQYRSVIDEAFDTDFVGDAGEAVSSAFDNIVSTIEQRALEIAKRREALVNAQNEALNRQLGFDPNSIKDYRAAQDEIDKLAQGFNSLNVQLTLSNTEASNYIKTQEVLNKLAEKNRDVSASQKEQIKALISSTQNINTILRAQQSIYSDLQRPQEEYATSLTAIENLYATGLISLEQYNQALRDNQLALLETQNSALAGFERSIIKFEDGIRNTASQVEDLFTSAFKGAEDAFVEFTKTGQLSFKALADSILADITRIAFRETVANLVFGGQGGGDGLFSLIGSGLSSLGGGGGAAAATSGGFDFGAGAGAGLAGFARGGSFEVNTGSALGNLGGTDNRLIAFRARDGEQVTVTPPGETGNTQQPVHISMTINTPDADSFQRSQSQILARAQAIAARNSAKNN